MRQGPYLCFVSIPQRSDLNIGIDVCGHTHLAQFQSRNGLIWTVLLMFSFVSTVVSIPQRSDLNGHCHRAHCPADNVSIPQRSDLNSRGLFSMVYESLFQSRNGLIWTNTYDAAGRIYRKFQSRNGLIWTDSRYTIRAHRIRVSIPQRSDLNKSIYTSCAHVLLRFNPATVWFERLRGVSAGMESRCFNPATVWFELSPVSSANCPVV